MAEAPIFNRSYVLLAAGEFIRQVTHSPCDNDLHKLGQKFHFVNTQRGTIAALALICSSLNACRSARQPVIAVIPETTAQELWESEHAGAEQAAHRLGFHVYWNAPSREDDLSRQIQIVNNMVARHVAGLILSPDHSVALISSVRRALAEGIPTVVVGSPLGIDPGGKLSYIVNDDQAMGELVAKRLAPKLRAGDTVAILGVNPAMLSLVARATAIQSSLQAAVPGLQIVERHITSFGFDEAEQTTEDVIRHTAHLRAIVALDIIQTRASHFALRENPAEKPVILLGCDQDLDLVRLVRTGAIDAIVAQDTFTMGFDAVEAIARQRNGESVPARRAIAPVLVTRENVDQPAIQKVLDMDWSLQ